MHSLRICIHIWIWIDRTLRPRGGLVKNGKLYGRSIASLFLILYAYDTAQRATFGQYLRKDKSCSSLHLPKLEPELSILAARGILWPQLCDILWITLMVLEYYVLYILCMMERTHLKSLICFCFALDYLILIRKKFHKNINMSIAIQF